MDGFKRPVPKNNDPVKNQDLTEQKPNPPLPADEPLDVNQDPSVDQEADEAVVAGVTAIGGLTLKWQHLKKWLTGWWRNKKLRYTTLGSLMAVLAILLIVPLTRYGILNAVGIKASAQVMVVDDETNLPLKNALVRLGNVETESDETGVANVTGVRLGNQELLVSKPGYGDFISPTKIQTGRNLIDEVRMTATGNRYAFRVLDWHSSTALKDVLAESELDGASAFSDEEGLLKLVTPPSDEPISLVFQLEGYNSLTFKTEPTNFQEQEVKLVREGYNAFISKRDGQFDLYRSLLDGSQVEKIVEATGKERERTLALSVDPSGQYAALVSTRDGRRNEDGFVLSSLYLVNLNDGALSRIDLSESIEIVGWSKERLVYTAQTAGASGYSPERFKIRSVQIGAMAADTLETSNYFHDVILADDRIYYGPGESFQQNRPAEHFMSFLSDGTDRRTHLESRTVRIARTDFDTLVLETIKPNFKQEWFAFSLSSQFAERLDGQPASFEYWSANAQFINSPDGNWLAWQEERDGKDVIMLRDGGGAQRVLANIEGARAPLTWIGNELVIFRVVKPGESADYIISLEPDAQPVKLSDVTNVAGN